MEKTIIALQSGKDTGKTATIIMVCDELKQYAIKPVRRGGPRWYGRPPEVVEAILNIDGVIVGITSPGDTEEIIEEYVKPLIDAGCQVIVCATRSRGGSVKALKRLAGDAQPPFTIEKVEKASVQVSHDDGNQKTCAEIVKRVHAAVAKARNAAA